MTSQVLPNFILAASTTQLCMDGWMDYGTHWGIYYVLCCIVLPSFNAYCIIALIRPLHRLSCSATNNETSYFELGRLCRVCFKMLHEDVLVLRRSAVHA